MCLYADKLLSTIINKYFLMSYCLTFIVDSKYGQIVDNITINSPYLYYKQNEENSNLTNLSKFILTSLEFGCINYIICIKEPRIFLQEFDQNILKTIQRNGNRKFIFIPEHCDKDSKDNIEAFLLEDIVQFYPNTLLVIPIVNNTDTICEILELGTQKYVGDKDYNNLVILDKWFVENESFQLGADLFPDKLENFHGREIKVASFTYKPYTIVVFDDNGNLTDLHGIELKVMIEFCIIYNCSIDMIVDKYEWGYLYENRTGRGILGNLGMDKADLAIAGCFQWYKEYGLLDYSETMLRAGITCLVPIPLLLPTYFLPILPFSAAMWCLVFVSVCCISVVLYYVKRFTGESYSIIQSVIQVIGIMVGQNLHETKLSAIMRHLFNLIFLFALIIYNAYTSGLSSSMTVKTYGKHIDTVQDLADSNLQWAGTHDAWTFSLRNADSPTMVTMKNKFRSLSVEEMESRQTTRDLAFGVEKMPEGTFALGDYITEKAVGSMNLMSEDIYFEYTVIAGRPSSPFIPKLNKIIRRLHQAGIFKAWEIQVALKYSSYYIQAGVIHSKFSKDQHYDLHVIGIFHILGPLLLLAFGYTLALFVFIGEIIYGGKGNKNIGREKYKNKDAEEQNKNSLNKRVRSLFKIDLLAKLKIKRFGRSIDNINKDQTVETQSRNMSGQTLPFVV